MKLMDPIGPLLVEAVSRSTRLRRGNLGRGTPHTVADITSILAFVETAFLPGHQHLTQRDAHAHDLLDLFDFVHAPSLGAAVGQAAPPTVDCSPVQ